MDRVARPKTNDWRDGLSGLLVMVNFFSFLGGLAVGGIIDGAAVFRNKRLSLLGRVVVFVVTLGLVNLAATICYYVAISPKAG